jgi:ABC-type dipeptide/oligopeptide/nickel transport system permease component
VKRYIAKRVLLLLFLLGAVSLVVFFLIHLIPGDPAARILGEGANTEDIERLRHELNLHKPILSQYLDYVKNLLDLDFGNSIFDRQPVLHHILTFFPNTLYLAVAAVMIAFIISFPLGTWGAVKGETNPAVNTTVSLISSLGLAIPNFFLGPLLIIIFSIKLGWLPVSGSGGVSYIILPALTLGISMSAFLARMIKGAVGSELKKPYVLLARAKGFTGFQVFRRHILKNAMIPIITTVGLQFGALLGGTIITETIFSWQGIGSLLVNSINRRDYPMIQGIIVFITFLYLIVNFLVDMSYFIFDPRIRCEYETKIKTKSKTKPGLK